MGIEEDFGWVPPGERADPYVQSVVDLLSAFEKRFTSDGVLEFRLQTLMHRFKEDEKSYPAFQSKQKITVDKINRNGLYGISWNVVPIRKLGLSGIRGSLDTMQMIIRKL